MEKKSSPDYGRQGTRENRPLVDLSNISWKDWRTYLAIIFLLACVIFLIWRANHVLGPG